MLSSAEIAADATLSPHVERFRLAVESRAGGGRIEYEDEDLELFAAALSAISRLYVDPVDPAILVDAAIDALQRYEPTESIAGSTPVDAALSAMLTSLDPSCAYLDADVYTELQRDKAVRHGGVGLELTVKERELVVVAPIEGSPAWRAGVVAQDRLTEIDGVPTIELSLVNAIRHLRGPVGSKVALTIRRADSETATVLTLTRELIRLRPVVYRQLSPGALYIRVSQFAERTSGEVRHALSLLADEDELKGVILDLRNNPGGVLSQAVRTGDLFLASGLMVQTKGRSAGQDENFFATVKGRWETVPMVVLVNRGTAGGSEILAAALQYKNRAIVLGTATAGHGTVHTIIPIGSDSGLRLTTSRAYAPDGRAISLGVQPDVFVESGAGPAEDPSLDSLVVRALEHLEK